MKPGEIYFEMETGEFFLIERRVEAIGSDYFDYIQVEFSEQGDVRIPLKARVGGGSACALLSGWTLHIPVDNPPFTLLEHLLTERRRLYAQLAAVQARCTELIGERRQSLRARVREFFTVAGQRVPDRVGAPSEAELRLGLSLVLEECGELLEACLNDRDEWLKFALVSMQLLVNRLPVRVDMPAAIDACGDVDYVVEGFRIRCGVDGAPIMDRIHAANMAKFGGPKDPATGKQLKPDGWTPPDIAEALRLQGWEDSDG